jgi:hypothetical protein
MYRSREERLVLEKLNSDRADSETPGKLLMEPMYYIGLDVHKQKIGSCAKDGFSKYKAALVTRLKFSVCIELAA